MALAISVVCVVLVSVPVLAFLAMRLTSNQFVRETEQALINQAAIYANVYAQSFAAQGGPPIGPQLDTERTIFWERDLTPWPPSLNLRLSEVLGPLPESPLDPVPPLDRRHDIISYDIVNLAREARRTTLAGAFFLDHTGRDIRTGSALSFANEQEVRAALMGDVGSALRTRGDTYNRHPLTSFSRDTWYRVFVAYPAIVDDRVIGVVYLSRTPSNFAKFVASERGALLAMLGVTLLIAAVIGALFLRLFLRPIKALSAQSSMIASGQMSEPKPLAHYGMRELADLGNSVVQMSKTLTDRSRQISVYTDHVTHELKSPVTSIMGAAELLNSGDLSQTDRARLQNNISDEAQRMGELLDKLREMTRLRGAPTTGECQISEILPDIAGLSVELTPDSERLLPMLADHGRMVFQHLAQNAAQNGATRLLVDYRTSVLTVSDNGAGITHENLPHVTDPFFTTRREEGGTGLGLAIVSTILQNYRAELAVVPSAAGASLKISFEG